MKEKELSHNDPGQVLKNVHERGNSSLRITSANTSVPSNYSRVDLTYGGNNSVTNALFYKGTQAEIRHVIFKPDVSKSLNNTYFDLYSENNESLYHVWYNVDGMGTDPAPLNSIGIEINIQENDPAEIVKFATQLSLQSYEDFETKILSDTELKISNSRFGISTNTTDFGTGFDISTIQEGEEELIKSIDVPFENGIRYIFNQQERKFVVESVSSVSLETDLDADTGDNIAISRHEKPRNIKDVANFVKANLSTSIFTNIWTYTAIEDLRLRILKIKADTIGTFRVKVDGTIEDYFITSPSERNCRFMFMEELDVGNGLNLEIEFLPERLRLDNYNFFFRMALLRLNKNKLHLDVLVGVKEEYKPTERIIKLNKKVDKLRKDIEKFIKNTWGEKKQKELSKLFKENKEERNKWVNFLQKVYNPKIEKIELETKRINKKLCKNYTEFLKGEDE